MTEATLAHHVNTALFLTLLLSAPALIAAALVGLVVGLMQAVTQIQDQSLPLVFKIVVVMVCLIFLGGHLAGPLIDYTDRVIQDISTVR